jgi:hypothetical protein
MLRARVFVIGMVALMIIAVAAQGDEPAAQAEEPTAQAEEQTAPVGEKEAPARKQFEEPILLTCAGQSVDIKLAGVLLKRLEIEYISNSDATAADLKGIKTLIVVPGYSSKGLGSAGISRDDEMKRVEALLAGAAKADVRVMALHLGGKARRGVQSDDFNEIVVRASDLAIIVAQGDEDGFFTKICKDAGVPLEVVEVMASAMEPLRKAFPADKAGDEE